MPCSVTCTTTRDRRLTLETRSLEAELVELEEAVGATETRLRIVGQEKERRLTEREKLLIQLDRERRQLVTPLLAGFERLQHTMGQLEQQRALLTQLIQLRQHVGAVDEEQQRVVERIHALESAATARAADRRLIVDQPACSLDEHVHFEPAAKRATARRRFD
jgi:hypothetical protein